MPKGKELNSVEKGQIIALKNTGFSNREIGRRLKRSPKVINNFVSKSEKYGKKKRQGRPKNSIIGKKG